MKIKIKLIDLLDTLVNKEGNVLIAQANTRFSDGSIEYSYFDLPERQSGKHVAGENSDLSKIQTLKEYDDLYDAEVLAVYSDATFLAPITLVIKIEGYEIND